MPTRPRLDGLHRVRAEVNQPAFAALGSAPACSTDTFHGQDGAGSPMTPHPSYGVQHAVVAAAERQDDGRNRRSDRGAQSASNIHHSEILGSQSTICPDRVAGQATAAPPRRRALATVEQVMAQRSGEAVACSGGVHRVNVEGVDGFNSAIELVDH